MESTTGSDEPRTDLLRGVGVGLAVILGVAVLALGFELALGLVPRSPWYEPILWSVSGLVAAGGQAVLWHRHPRGLAPVGAVLLALAAYAANPPTPVSFLSETPVVWTTGAICLVSGLLGAASNTS